MSTHDLAWAISTKLLNSREKYTTNDIGPFVSIGIGFIVFFIIVYICLVLFQGFVLMYAANALFGKKLTLIQSIAIVVVMSTIFSWLNTLVNGPVVKIQNQ